MNDLDADKIYKLIHSQRPKFVLRVGEYEIKTISMLKDGLGRYIYNKGDNTFFGYDLQIVEVSCLKLITIVDEYTNVEKNALPPNQLL